MRAAIVAQVALLTRTLMHPLCQMHQPEHQHQHEGGLRHAAYCQLAEGPVSLHKGPSAKLHSVPHLTAVHGGLPVAASAAAAAVTG